MLGVAVKTTTPVDVASLIQTYLREAYSAEDAATAAPACKALQERRTALLQTLDAKAPLADFKAAFFRYYSTLAAATRKIPFAEDTRTSFLGVKTGGRLRGAPVRWTYQDALLPNAERSSYSPAFEVQALLFNYAARLSREALFVKSQKPKTEGDGAGAGAGAGAAAGAALSEACLLFRKSAWAFGRMTTPQHVTPANGSDRTLDVSFPVCGFLSQLMLAQAQVCVFEKAITPPLAFSPLVIARLAAGASDLFSQACARLDGGGVEPRVVEGVTNARQYFGKCAYGWEETARMQADCMQAAAFLWQARALHEDKKWGAEIASLRVALALVQRTHHYDARLRAGNASLLSNRDGLSVSVQNALKQAENDNTMYFDTVPAEAAAPEAKVMVTVLAEEEIEKAGAGAGAGAGGEGAADDGGWSALSFCSAATREAAEALDAALTKNATAVRAGAGAGAGAVAAALTEMQLPAALETSTSTSTSTTNGDISDELWTKVCKFTSPSAGAGAGAGGVAGLRRLAAAVGAAADDANTRTSSITSSLDHEAQQDAQLRARITASDLKVKPPPASGSLAAYTDLRASVGVVEGLLRDSAGVDAGLATQLGAFEREQATLLERKDAATGAWVPLTRAELAARLPAPPAPVAEAEDAEDKTGVKAAAAAVRAALAALQEATDAKTAAIDALTASTSTSSTGALAAAVNSGVPLATAVEAAKAKFAASTEKITQLEGEETAALAKVRVANDAWRSAVAAAAAAASSAVAAPASDPRTVAIQALYTCADRGLTLKHSLEQGGLFYRDLVQDTVLVLAGRARDYCAARDVERRMVLDEWTGAGAGAGGAGVVAPMSVSNVSSGAGAGAGAGAGYPSLSNASSNNQYQHQQQQAPTLQNQGSNQYQQYPQPQHPQQQMQQQPQQYHPYQQQQQQQQPQQQQYYQYQQYPQAPDFQQQQPQQQYQQQQGQQYPGAGPRYY